MSYYIMYAVTGAAVLNEAASMPQQVHHLESTLAFEGVNQDPDMRRGHEFER